MARMPQVFLGGGYCDVITRTCILFLPIVLGVQTRFAPPFSRITFNAPLFFRGLRLGESRVWWTRTPL